MYTFFNFVGEGTDTKLVLADSDTLYEEITTFGIPCFTIRQNTGRPVIIEKGMNILVGNDRGRILEESFKILNGNGKKGKIPYLWDGKAAERIVNILLGRPYKPFKPER